LAIRTAFERTEGRARPSLCLCVWEFLLRPRFLKLDYMLALNDINVGMRAILVDWLSDVHESHHARPPVLFRTVQIVDAYMTTNPELSRRRFQLLGVVAFLIASKVEREFAWGHLTGVQHLADCTANTYTAEDISKMESSVLGSIGWPKAGWGPYHFLVHYASLEHLEARDFFVAQCCLEGSLLDYHMSRHTPSLVALAAYYLACLFRDKRHDPELLAADEAKDAKGGHLLLGIAPMLAKESGRDVGTVWRCVVELHRFLLRLGEAPNPMDAGFSDLGLSSLKRRFSKERYLRAAELIWLELSPKATAVP